jgi:hypothetical protein
VERYGATFLHETQVAEFLRDLTVTDLVQDMLEVGNGMTPDQDKAHFTMWCIMASPLVRGPKIQPQISNPKLKLKSRVRSRLLGMISGR